MKLKQLLENPHEQSSQNFENTIKLYLESIKRKIARNDDPRVIESMMSTISRWTSTAAMAGEVIEQAHDAFIRKQDARRAIKVIDSALVGFK